MLWFSQCPEVPLQAALGDEMGKARAVRLSYGNRKSPWQAAAEKT